MSPADDIFRAGHRVHSYITILLPGPRLMANRPKDWIFLRKNPSSYNRFDKINVFEYICTVN